jgi:hypothetical protein
LKQQNDIRQAQRQWLACSRVIVPSSARTEARYHRTQSAPYVQVVKERSGNRVTGVHIKVIYGEPSEVLALMGGHTAYVERTNLTSRQMNGRLVRKTLSYSKQLAALKAACAWEDWIYTLTRTVDTLSVPSQIGPQRWKRQTPAIAAKLTDHIWTIKELLMTVVPPMLSTTKG